MKDSDAKLKRLAARVGRRLRDQHRYVVTAESCTGGWIAKTLTDVAGSSQWFGEGSVCPARFWTKRAQSAKQRFAPWRPARFGIRRRRWRSR